MYIYIYVCKVDISNGNCARETAFILDSRMYILEKVSTFLKQRISGRREGLKPSTLESMPNALAFELSGPDICYSTFWNAGCSGIRSRKVSKLRDLHLELADRSEIWQALRLQCCRCACQISKRYGNLKYQSRGFETSRDLTIRRLFGYWDGVQTFAISRFEILAAVV